MKLRDKMNTKWNATVAILTLSLLCVACSGDESTSDAPLDFVAAADAGLIEMDMGPTLHSPPRIAERTKILLVFCGLDWRQKPSNGSWRACNGIEHFNQRLVLFGGNDFQPEKCQDFGPKRFLMRLGSIPCSRELGSFDHRRAAESTRST